MATARVKCIGILTCGGDCSGLNAVIRAVVKTALSNGVKVVGVNDGFLGLVNHSMRILGPKDVSGILPLGGTILGSTNKDNPFHMLEKDAAGKVRFRDRSGDIVRRLKLLGIEALVVLGGDGSMTIADRLVRKGVKIVGVPKTIDNDLVGTDQTFGHDSAVSVAVESIDRLHTTASSHHRVIVVEVMGRYAGWLALRAGLAGGANIILIPEIPYDEGKIAGGIAGRMRAGKRSSIVVMGEGAHSVKGGMVVDRIVPHSPEKVRLGGVSHQLAQRLETLSGIETRVVILGHVVRGGTPTPFDRILATRFGVEAAELVLKGRFGRMVTFHHGGMSSVPLSLVGGRCRKVPLNDELIKIARSTGVLFGD